jgi:hypothetical protein
MEDKRYGDGRQKVEGRWKTRGSREIEDKSSK